MKKKRILLVDDEPRLIRLVQTVLRTEGFDIVVASEGQQAVDLAALEPPDLVLLDIVLADDLDGYEVCRRVREFSQVPVVMLTARAREEDKLRGFEVGADDYLTKPFSAKELLARIKAVLKRSRQSEGAGARLACGPLSLDLVRRRVTVNDREVKLTATEYELLKVLATHAGRVMLHGELLAAVWGPEYRDEVDYLRDYVRFLRRKIEIDPRHPRLLVSRPGVGYLLDVEGL